MILVLDAAGLALLALFAVAIVADVRNWWPCATCGEPDDHPLHYCCLTHGRDCRQPHHSYRKATWPFAVLVILMGAVLIGFLVDRR